MNTSKHPWSSEPKLWETSLSILSCLYLLLKWLHPFIPLPAWAKLSWDLIPLSHQFGGVVNVFSVVFVYVCVCVCISLCVRQPAGGDCEMSDSYYMHWISELAQNNKIYIVCWTNCRRDDPVFSSSICRNLPHSSCLTPAEQIREKGDGRRSKGSWEWPLVPLLMRTTCSPKKLPGIPVFVMHQTPRGLRNPKLFPLYSLTVV